MDDPGHYVSLDTIRMIVSSVTKNGNAELSELEAERLLNAIARAQSGVPTGAKLKS